MRPLGKNGLKKFLSEAANILGPSNCSRSKVANHSACKIAITKLVKENINPIHVSELNGHKKYSKLKVISYCFDIAAKTLVRSPQ